MRERGHFRSHPRHCKELKASPNDDQTTRCSDNIKKDVGSDNAWGCRSDKGNIVGGDEIRGETICGAEDCDNNPYKHKCEAIRGT